MNEIKLPVGKKKSSSGGFTLIEVLVVLAIMAVVVRLGIASYNNFQESKKIEVVAENVASTLRLAQSKATNGQKNCTACGGSQGNCANTEPLDGWFFDTYESGGVYYYEVYGKCGSTEFDRQTHKVQGDMSITTLADPIRFNPFGGTDLSASTDLTVSDGQSGTADYLVTISISGDVEVTESP